MRIVWLTVRRITNLNWELKSLTKCMTTVLTHRYDISTVLLHCPITSMTLNLSYKHSNWACDNQSCSRILLIFDKVRNGTWLKTLTPKISLATLFLFVIQFLWFKFREFGFGSTNTPLLIFFLILKTCQLVIVLVL